MGLYFITFQYFYIYPNIVIFHHQLALLLQISHWLQNCSYNCQDRNQPTDVLYRDKGSLMQ